MIRTFIAIDLPADLLHALAETQTQLRDVLRAHQLDTALRWSLAQNLHLTLRFLGDTGDAQRAEIVARLLTVAVKTTPFALEVDVSGRNLGGFPTLRHPRVVWVGIGGDMRALRQLQGEMEALAKGVGFVPELKPYLPHLTLARAARDVDRRTLARAGRTIGDFMHQVDSQMADGEVMRFTVDRVVFYQSELGSGGSRYTPLAEVPLAGV